MLSFKAPSTRIRIFLNPQLFFFRILLLSTRIRRIRQRIRKKKIRSRSGKKYIRNESDNVWMGPKNNTRIFSAKNRQKNKNIQPGPKKQHSYINKKSVCKKSTNVLVNVVFIIKQST